VPAAEVPRSAGHTAQERWLYDWWQRIDTWISQHRPPEGARQPTDAAGQWAGT